MRRVFCRTIIYAFYTPKGSFWEKLLFEICASHLRISSDSRCGFIAQNFSLELSNLNPKCPDHPFSEKTCWNNYQFLYFFTVSSNFSEFWQEIMTGLPKVPSTVSEIFKRDKISHQKRFFSSVSDFELTIFRILTKNVAIITKAAFYMSRLTFCQKKGFGEIKFNVCGFSGKKSQNFGGKVSRRISEGTNFAKKVIRNIQWLWERKFRTFPQKFPAELSERHSTYPKDEF